ncbi:hypothetical protein TRFO_13875 [Tritrichomonas foetus]|uniref:Uncharacterized protein n=1 Tax=Tritrichomonas foetus TaxID=1144522 RepID=A0A1J4KWU8_9EUKA|nr:hypothetical protein TRFO_13875 [Tritrichomonas foetus]|eukprot:OHT15711.1 hypothetical protein TRFO_13875 [Tritrichomonas foetus]
MYFQSMLSLYHSFADEKKPVVISQLNEYQMPEEFFHFLLEKMEPSNLAASLSKTIMDISIDYVNSLGPNVSIKNVKQFVQYLLKLISLKTQPTSYEKYTSFLQIAFRMASQHNHESIYNQIIKYPHEQSVIPISVLCQTNPQFSNGALQILVNTFPNFKRDQNLVIWMVACTNLFEKCQYDGSDDKPIRASIDTALLDKFIPITRKIHLLESSLHFLPSKTGDELIASHVVNLLSCISIASTIDEVALSLNLAKKVLMRMKQNPITQITPDKIISSVFSYILPAYRTGKSINASLLDFCNEIDSETLQARISNSIKTNDITLSTLFLISRFPTPETIPYLLAKARVDQKSQYVAIFYFLSHNLVPFRYLPRLFEILAPSDLHFLNEIFEQKPQLYCTAALKFLASCRVVEKIEYISCLFAQAKTLPVIKSTYARGAFLSVACHRALSKMPGCPIRLLLDYIHRCIIATYTNEPNEDEETPDELSQSKENNTETSNSNETTENSHVDDNENQIENEEKKIEPNAEVPADDEENENENNKDNNNEKKNGKDNNEDDIETAQVKTSASAALSLSLGQTDPLDLISDDIASLSLPPVSLYDVMKAMGILNRPTFCQSQAIRDWCSADSETKQILIDMALEQVKSGNTVFTIIIGSLSDDPILIHNCVQTLAQCDLFLLAFFFTTAASCNPQLVLKELKDYVTKEPEAAPQSFVTRLFTSRPSTMPRRQRIARRCIIGMAPFVPFSQYLYDTLMASMPNADESANSPLTCESIIAVCSRLTHKEVLHSLIDRLVSRSDAFLDQPLFVPAIIHVLNANQTLTESDALSVIKL